MTAPSPALAALLTDPGFTPGAAHLEELFALLESAEREEAPELERLLARGGERALTAALERFRAAAPSLRARLANVLGRFADARASTVLRPALRDADARVVRRAAIALGKLEYDAENEAALRAAWVHADSVVKRALAEALGKLGGAEADALLAAETSDDPELRRLIGRARELILRRRGRGGTSAIRTSAPLASELMLLAECRAGLADFLTEELAALGAARPRSPTVVELPFAGSLEALFVARTALGFGLRVGLPAAPDDATAVALALASTPARAALSAWTEGEVRYRLSFAEGGHQRALVFRIAEAVRRVRPELVNDSREANWEVVVVRRPGERALVLVPLAYEDPRFAYRQRDVRAASHPTIAAALARAAGANPRERVWDPFVGSGLELVERAKLGPYGALFGSDIAGEALAAARENLDAARVQAELVRGAATELHPPDVSLILTNPPMGRRLQRDGSIAGLLEGFVAHAARVLRPGGRLIWLSPLPERTRRAAAAAGLVPERGPAVDVGGFDAELQTLRRR